MRLSTAGIKLLKSIEGLRLRPYHDQTGIRVYRWVDGATIGYGHLVKREEWPFACNGITESCADAVLQRDLAPFERTVNIAVDASLEQHQFDALVMLAYNIGAWAFASSSVVALIDNPKADTPYTSIEAAWKAWNKSRGKVNRGLINRRAAEWTLYTSGRELLT